MKRIISFAASVLISSLTAQAVVVYPVATNLVTTANGGTGTMSQYLQGGVDSFRDQNGLTSTEVVVDNGGAGKAWVAATFGSVKTFNHLIVEQYPGFVVAGSEIQVANVANPDGNIDSNWTTVSGGSFSGVSQSSESTINLSGNYTSAGVRLRATDTSNIPGAQHQMRVREIYAFSNYSDLARTATSVTGPGFDSTATLTDQKTTLQAFNSNITANPDLTFTWATPQVIGALQMHGGTGANSEYISAYTVQYWNGSSFVNALSVSGNTQKTTYDFFSDAITTTQLRVHFLQGGSSEGNGLRVSEVFVFEALPEPTSLGLFAVGGLALLRRRRAR